MISGPGVVFPSHGYAAKLYKNQGDYSCLHYVGIHVIMELVWLDHYEGLRNPDGMGKSSQMWVHTQWSSLDMDGNAYEEITSTRMHMARTGIQVIILKNQHLIWRASLHT